MPPQSRSILGDGVLVVRVQGIRADGFAVVVDQLGKTRDITLGVLPGYGRAPRSGETWVVSRMLGQWAFVAYVGPAQPVPVVTGSRADPATIATLLQALDQAGLIDDQTTV